MDPCYSRHIHDRRSVLGREYEEPVYLIERTRKEGTLVTRTVGVHHLSNFLHFTHKSHPEHVLPGRTSSLGSTTVVYHDKWSLLLKTWVILRHEAEGVSCVWIRPTTTRYLLCHTRSCETPVRVLTMSYLQWITICDWTRSVYMERVT